MVNTVYQYCWGEFVRTENIETSLFIGIALIIQITHVRNMCKNFIYNFIYNKMTLI